MPEVVAVLRLAVTFSLEACGFFRSATKRSSDLPVRFHKVQPHPPVNANERTSLTIYSHFFLRFNLKTFTFQMIKESTIYKFVVPFTGGAVLRTVALLWTWRAAPFSTLSWGNAATGSLCRQDVSVWECLRPHWLKTLDLWTPAPSRDTSLGLCHQRRVVLSALPLDVPGLTPAHPVLPPPSPPGDGRQPRLTLGLSTCPRGRDWRLFSLRRMGGEAWIAVGCYATPVTGRSARSSSCLSAGVLPRFPGWHGGLPSQGGGGNLLRPWVRRDRAPKVMTFRLSTGCNVTTLYWVSFTRGPLQPISLAVRLTQQRPPPPSNTKGRFKAWNQTLSLTPRN